MLTGVLIIMVMKANIIILYWNLCIQLFKGLKNSIFNLKLSFLVSLTIVLRSRLASLKQYWCIIGTSYQINNIAWRSSWIYVRSRPFSYWRFSWNQTKNLLETSLLYLTIDLMSRLSPNKTDCSLCKWHANLRTWGHLWWNIQTILVLVYFIYWLKFAIIKVMTFALSPYYDTGSHT